MRLIINYSRKISQLSIGEEHTLPILELNKTSVSCAVNTFIVFYQRANLVIRKNMGFVTHKSTHKHPSHLISSAPELMNYLEKFGKPPNTPQAPPHARTNDTPQF